MVDLFVCHGQLVQRMALKYGWRPGARYTNTRDIRSLGFVDFIDIDWKNYRFEQHLRAVKEWRPKLTVARDIISFKDVDLVLKEAEQLSKYSDEVIVVPKNIKLGPKLDAVIPQQYRLGYSLPSKYGGTKISIKHFTRKVHILGGRPDTQRMLANYMDVRSVDCNRFTLDASFGDYFDGETFRPHPKGGYEVCLKASLQNIASLWEDYKF